MENQTQTNTPKVSNCQKRMQTLLARKKELADSLAEAKAELAREKQRGRKWLCYVVGELSLEHRLDVLDGLLDQLPPPQKEKASRLLAVHRHSRGADGVQS